MEKTGELLPVVVCLFGRFGACSLFSARFVLPCPLFILRSCFQCFAELQNDSLFYFILPWHLNDSVQGMLCHAGASCGYSGDGMCTNSSIELPCGLRPQLEKNKTANNTLEKKRPKNGYQYYQPRTKTSRVTHLQQTLQSKWRTLGRSVASRQATYKLEKKRERERVSLEKQNQDIRVLS